MRVFPFGGHLEGFLTAQLEEKEDLQGVTALFMAAFHDHVSVVKVLLKAKADKD